MENTKLGVCVVKSYQNCDYKATIASVDVLPVSTSIHYMDSFSCVQQYLLTSTEDWNLILYGREALDSRFKDAIEVMLSEESVSAYKFFCTVKTSSGPIIIESVRLFKRGVFLKKDSLRPAQPELSVIRILDGWIYEHGTAKDIYKIFRNGKNSRSVGKTSE